MSAAGSAPPKVRVQHVDLEGDPRGIRRASQGVEESALSRWHEFIPMAVIGKLQARILGGLADAVEDLSGLQRILARERVPLVIDPGTDDPRRAEALRLLEGTRRRIAQLAKPGVRRLTPEAGLVERGTKLRERVLVEASCLDLAEAHRTDLRQRAGQVLWQLRPKAPELEADGAAQGRSDVLAQAGGSPEGPQRQGANTSGQSGQDSSSGRHAVPPSNWAYKGTVPLTRGTGTVPLTLYFTHRYVLLAGSGDRLYRVPGTRIATDHHDAPRR